MYAHQFCIIASSSKKFNKIQKSKFLKQFPQGVIQRESPYYILKLTGFDDYSKASKELHHVRQYYKTAFIINCVTPKSQQIIMTNKKLTPINTHGNQTNSIVALDEPVIADKKLNKTLYYNEISKNNKKPHLNEPKILKSYEIPTPSKMTTNMDYDILSYKRYMNALFEYNNQIGKSFYQKKIDYILTYIKKDRYNFDIYATAHATTGHYLSSYSSTPSNTGNSNEDTTIGVALHADKLIYDGERSLVYNGYNTLNQRLADIKELNTKERLNILGTTIYSNVYLVQEKLALFKTMLKAQQKLAMIVNQGYKKGKISVINNIDAKSDLLNLRRNILSLQTQYLNSIHILRYSIKSKAKNRYRLLPSAINWDLKPLKLLKKEAINTNSDIAIESNILKIRQMDILAQKRRYYPTINFTSSAGYGTSDTKVFSLNSGGMGTYWQMGLTLRMPIYNRDDIRLSKEKSTYDALKQKKILSSKIQSILTQVDHSYAVLQRIKKENSIFQEQVSLQSLKMKTAKEKFLEGVLPYKTYSDALNNFLRYKIQLIESEQNYIKEVVILNSLVGNKKSLYEQN